jgi:AcrR family transcriptional regulator
MYGNGTERVRLGARRAGPVYICHEPMSTSRISTPRRSTGAAPGRDQRERLLEGVIKSVQRRGYSETTIAHVVAQAGVSRSTFYEHFADLEACFLAAYRELAARLAADLRGRTDGAPWAGKAQAMLGHVLDPAIDEPLAAWRLLLSQARGAGATVRAERERVVSELEGEIEAILSSAPAGAQTLDIPAKALLGGVRGVISIRGHRADLGDREELARDLAAWVLSYSVEGVHRRRDRAAWVQLGRTLPIPPPAHASDAPNASGASSEPARLPRRHDLPPAQLARVYYGRIVMATARVVREKGYAAMSVSNIVAAARVSRTDFYNQFLNKRDAFMAMQTESMQQSVAATSSAFFAAPTWPERVWSGLRALLEHMAGAPELTYAAIVEPSTVGEDALQRHTDTLRSYNLFLQEGYRQRPQAERLPHICSDAITGAMLETVHDDIYNDRIEQLPRLLPQLAHVALAPFIGPEEAGALVDAKVDALRAEARG